MTSKLQIIEQVALFIEPFLTGAILEMLRNYTPFPEYFPKRGHVCHVYFREQFITVTVDSYIDSFYGRRVSEEKQVVQKSVFVFEKST